MTNDQLESQSGDAQSPVPLDRRLAGKVALVTGAARRLGAEIARVLHGAGANTVLHYRSSAEDADQLARELNAIRPGSAALVSGDLLEIDQLPALAQSAAQAFGRLDVLVNNASSFYPTPVGDITEIDWDDLIGTNLKAPLFLTQAAAPALHTNQGLVINLCDIHGMRPLRRHPVYSVAKAGLIMLTRSLARELGPHVRVNGIAPGPVLWPEDGLDKALQAEIIDRTSLKRPGSATDVARAALFFAAEAPYVTGQILAVDGGRSVGW
jgi:pteridine reductase